MRLTLHEHKMWASGVLLSDRRCELCTVMHCVPYTLLICNDEQDSCTLHSNNFSLGQGCIANSLDASCMPDLSAHCGAASYSNAVKISTTHNLSDQDARIIFSSRSP